MPSSIYSSSATQKEFRQGEIVTNLLQYVFNASSGRVIARKQRYCVIASQDCDLLRDWEDRENGENSSINSILIYPASPAEERSVVVGNSPLWKRAKSNTDERFHVLEECPGDVDLQTEGLPPLIVDFRKFFSGTPDQLYRQVEAGDAKRRCILNSPYRDHFRVVP